MSAKIIGVPQLHARLDALKPSPTMMRALGLAAVAEQKKLVPRRTGNLGRSIGLATVTDTTADTVAGANYAAAVESGTRPHVIVPRRRKALRFAASPGGARLSGTPRSGSDVIFAKRVRHPGTRPQPFMLPGALAAVRRFGADIIVGLWNKAA